jgi:hypothetical protein
MCSDQFGDDMTAILCDGSGCVAAAGNASWSDTRNVQKQRDNVGMW